MEIESTGQRMQSATAHSGALKLFGLLLLLKDVGEERKKKTLALWEMEQNSILSQSVLSFSDAISKNSDSRAWTAVSGRPLAGCMHHLHSTKHSTHIKFSHVYIIREKYAFCHLSHFFVYDTILYKYFSGCSWKLLFRTVYNCKTILYIIIRNRNVQ